MASSLRAQPPTHSPCSAETFAREGLQDVCQECGPLLYYARVTACQHGAVPQWCCGHRVGCGRPWTEAIGTAAGARQPRPDQAPGPACSEDDRIGFEDPFGMERSAAKAASRVGCSWSPGARLGQHVPGPPSDSMRASPCTYGTGDGAVLAPVAIPRVVMYEE